ncbi:hypothetical protein LCGC14_1817900, partial [marine sediment metagenome]
YWELNFIPHLNIYRKDLVPAGLDVISYPKLDVKAVILSHVHMDHYGHIGFLDKEIPVVASPITLALLKGIQDMYSRGAGSEVIYFNEKVPEAKNPKILKSTGKSFGRNLISTIKCENNLSNYFWESAKKKGTIEEGSITSLEDTALPFSITPYEIDHSVYGANAYILEGDRTIAYTGDIRRHGKYEKQSNIFIQKARDAEILIIDGDSHQ